jgi:hypothetical protein
MKLSRYFLLLGVVLLTLSSCSTINHKDAIFPRISEGSSPVYTFLLDLDSEITNNAYTEKYAEEAAGFLENFGYERGSYTRADMFIFISVNRINIPTAGAEVYPVYDQLHRTTHWVHTPRETRPALQVKLEAADADDYRTAEVVTALWEVKWVLPLNPEHQKLSPDILMAMFFTDMIAQPSLFSADKR